MKVLVIGATSTAGSYYAYHLLKNTDYKVTCTYRKKKIKNSECAYKYYKLERSEINRLHERELNLNWEKNEIKKILEEEKANIIVNFASLCMVNQSWSKPNDWLTTNIIGQTKLCEAITEIDTTETYVHFTTPEVYGNSPKAIKEGYEHNPTTPYSLSRSTGDKITKMLLARKKGIKVRFVRAASIYCETQHIYRLIPRIIAHLQYEIPFKIEGSGETVRQYVHMSDVSIAINKIISTEEKGFDEYHIASKKAYSVNNIVNLCLEEMKSCKNINDVERGSARIQEDKYYMLDDSKLRSLGWNDEVDIKSGIKRVVEWMRNVNIEELDHDYIHRP